MANLDRRNPGEQELIGNGDHVTITIGAVAFDTHFFAVHPFFQQQRSFLSAMRGSQHTLPESPRDHQCGKPHGSPNPARS